MVFFCPAFVSALAFLMPVLNMMVMCVDVNPVIVSICDCTDQMSEGGKKDATYIADMNQERMN